MPTDLFMGINQLLQARHVGENHIVGQNNGEGFIADQRLRDEDGVTELPGLIASVNTSAPANLVIIHSGAVGAGEVLVEYDAEGLATLTFEAAVTAFSVTMITIPADHATTLAGEL